MAGLSKVANIAFIVTAGACFATSLAIVYMLLRKSEDDVYEGLEAIKSSRHTIIEVPVPSDVIGGVIGRNGSNIAKIQETTSTRINFKDEVKGSTNRVAIIRGKPKDAQAAERLIRMAVAERMSITSLDIHIPVKACGFIIGKNGANIRMIKEVSKARILLDSSGAGGELRKVTITGTSKEIETAKALIEEDVAKAVRQRKGGGPELSTATRTLQYAGRQLCDASNDESNGLPMEPRVEQLIPTGRDGFLEVFVSLVESPGKFWVQPALSVHATKLDKLCEEMTDFYKDPANAIEYCPKEIKASDLMAAPFAHDDTWYRAKVLSVEEDEYDSENSDVSLSYIDFGERVVLKKRDLRSLRDNFKRLPFQAVECELANVRPKDVENGWSKEATKTFDEIAYCTQWKFLMMKSLRENSSGVKTVVLVDTSGHTDVNLANELVERGFAEPIQPQD